MMDQFPEPESIPTTTPERGQLVHHFAPGHELDIVIPGRAVPVTIVVVGYRNGRIILVLKAEDDIEFEWDR